MRRNSGLIGVSKYSSLSGTSGVYDLHDQNIAKRDDNWPFTVSYSSSFNQGSYLLGDTVSVTINTEGVFDSTLYYTISYISGTLTTGDWTDLALSGSFAHTLSGATGTGTIQKNLTVYNNGSAKAVVFQIRTGSISGPIVHTTTQITIPQATLSLNVPAAYPEGSNVLVQITATNVRSGHTLWLTTNATTLDVNSTSAQYSSNWENGTVNASFPSAKQDGITEGDETYTVYLRRDSSGGTILSSTTYTITDTSNLAGVTVSPTTINEGESTTLTVDLNNYTSTINYTINSVTGTTETTDFTDGLLSGNMLPVSIGGGVYRYTVTKTLTSDLVTDGTKSFYFLIQNASNQFITNTNNVTVNDTSNITSTSLSTTSVNEGGSVTVNVFGNGVSSDTILYWSAELVSGNALNQSDIIGGTSGGFTFFASTLSGNFTVTFANDAFTEGSESIRFNIRKGSTAGTILATTAAVTVGDTSTGTPEPSGIGGQLATIESTLSSYTELTTESTVINAIEAMGYTVIATPRYGALAESMTGASGTLNTSGRFSIDAFDGTSSMELSNGFATSALNGYPYLCYAGFNAGAFQGTAVMLYRDYTSSTTQLKNLFYPNQDRNLFTHLRYNGGGVLENSSTSPITSTIYSDNQQPGINGYNSTSRFAIDDGAWGYVNGVTRLDGNGGPYHTTNPAQAVGCANQNGGDTSGANYFYFGANGASSTTYRFYIFTKFV